MATTKLMTADDLWNMGEDARHCELVRGELICMSPASARHGIIAATIARLIGNHVANLGAGAVFGAETGFVLARDPDVVLAPDAAFVCSDRLPPAEEQDRFLELAPDLVVEVTSPSDRLNDVNDKISEYLNAGVKLVWLIEPKSKRLTIHTPDRIAHILYEDDILNGGDVLPDFRLRVADIFI